MARKRARWKAYQGRIAPSRLVFIDETWVKTNMAPLRGWGTKGRRLKAYAPHGHWKTLTFIAALRHDRIDAPWVIDGPINGETFLLYVEKILAPTLSPGDVVVLDNLGSHKGKAARAIVWTNSWRSRTLGRCARCVRFLTTRTSVNNWRPPLALVSCSNSRASIQRWAS